MREQAFIVYNNVASATTAKRSLNGFTFFDRPIVSLFLKFGKKSFLISLNVQKIEYAKTKSDTIAKLDGTFRLRTHDANETVLGKRSSEEEGSSAKVARTEESDDDSDDHA